MRLIMEDEVTEEAAAKIRWINGPHAETIYKAWLAKNG